MTNVEKEGSSLAFHWRLKRPTALEQPGEKNGLVGDLRHHKHMVAQLQGGLVDHGPQIKGVFISRCVYGASMFTGA